MLIIGYYITRIPMNRSTFTPIHTILGYIFLFGLLIHFIFSVTVVRYPWRRVVTQILDGSASSAVLWRFFQRLSGWVLLASSLLMVLSGLGWYALRFWRALPFHPHVRTDILVLVSLAVHIFVSGKFTLLRRGIRGRPLNSLLIIGMILLTFSGIYIDSYLGVARKGTDEPNSEPVIVPGATSNNTRPHRMGKITVGFETYEFDVNEVTSTIRPDIFKPGYFSMFDVLLHIADKGFVELEYYFDETMNTHVIDTLNGEPNWWYNTYYDGGWPENNYFRLDHYPWKDGATLIFQNFKTSHLERAYSFYREEAERRKTNDGEIIIPKVIINGRNFHGEFHNVEVTPHNMRNDVFQEDIITALDVILSLGDQGKIDYGLQWYETIGTAGIVKNYWVEKINDDVAHGRCGFVYESGDEDVRGFLGNHIHLPSDSRVLNSPEYVLFFWICL
jgi:hypothetical protein